MTVARLRAALRRYGPSLLADGVAVAIGYAIALLLRFDGRIPSESAYWFAILIPAIVLLHLLLELVFGIHRRAWEYAGLQEVPAIALVLLIATVLVFAGDVFFFREGRPFPLGVVIMGGLISLLLVGGARYWPRLSATIGPNRGKSGKRVLIVGAGAAGQLVARELLQHRDWHYRPVGFIDDDPAKRRSRVHGLPVLGTRLDIPKVVVEMGVETVILAVPSASGAVLRELVGVCLETEARIQIVPGVPEMIEGSVQTMQVRDITVGDLIGREQVEIDAEACRQTFADRTVLVVGAAGSIGAELTRQLVAFNPSALVLLDNNESGLHEVCVELSLCDHSVRVEPILADISDAARVARVFAAAKPQVVFHAAAYKHVPLMEAQPEEAFRVNVLGTYNLLGAAEKAGVETLVFISSDKAVNPSCVMGATKRIGELLVGTAPRGNTRCCAVRFGNVVSSRGSVIPTFERQIECGGPVTVTDPEVFRYFMTLREAVQLVIQTAVFARAGEVYLLDMGDEIRVVDLAHKMIRLRGLRPDVDIAITYTGLRPGEKIREELVSSDELVTETSHPKIMRLSLRSGMTRERLVEMIERTRLLALDESADGSIADAIFEIARTSAAPAEQASGGGRVPAQQSG